MDMRSMLDIKQSAGGGLLEVGQEFSQSRLNLLGAAAAVRRRMWLIIVLVMTFVTVAVTHVLVRPSQYTAVTQLQLTNLKLTLGQDDAVFAEAQADPTFLETQLAIMRARKIGVAALERIGPIYKDVEVPSLLDRGLAELVKQFASWTQDGGNLRELLPSWGPAFVDPAEVDRQEDKQQRIALRRLQESYSVQRVGLSNIVELRFSASTPEEAAFGANEIARVYIADQDAARAEFAQSGSIWLRERLKDVGTRTRIISTAALPLNRSNTRGIVIIACAGILGLALGVTLAIGRQLLDNTVRTAEEAEVASGSECLGIVPLTTPVLFASREDFRPAAAIPEAPPARDRVPDFLREPSALKVRHTMRNVQAAVDDTLEGRGAACIGFTATREGEGTSTMAFAFANFLAAQEYRVLLMDCSPGPRSLSALLAPNHYTGLTEARRAQGSYANFILRGACSGLYFMPYGGATGCEESPVMLRPSTMSGILQGIQQEFDAVVFDLPALASMGEVRSTLPHLDHVVLVAESGRVEAAHMQAGIKAAGSLRGKLLGLVLNKARASDIGNASPGSAFLLLPPKYRDLPCRGKGAI